MNAKSPLRLRGGKEFILKTGGHDGTGKAISKQVDLAV
jgi:hypothetical protein